MLSHHKPNKSNNTVSPSSGSAPSLKCFTNCQLCLHGELIPQDLYFSPDTGLITPNYYYRTGGVERIDLGGAVVAPGFLDLQTNGMKGLHFSELGLDRGVGKLKGEGEGTAEGADGGEDEDEDEDVDVDGNERELRRIARREVGVGVTGWWATVPTVEEGRWRQILPLLKPRSFPNSASLLGAHAEGPYLHPSKKGAHNSSHFRHPSTTSAETLYDLPNTCPATLKLVTLAPELPGSLALITHLRETYPDLVISLGHSTADFATGFAALSCGADALTHVFNAMPPLHHREPGLAGLMTGAGAGAGMEHSFRPYYSVIADGIHLHPSVLRMAFRADPTRCILITDSIELAGLPDGVYPGNGQIVHRQRKVGNRVTLVQDEGKKQPQHHDDDNDPAAVPEEGAGIQPQPQDKVTPPKNGQEQQQQETLIGSCCTLDQCVTNMLSTAAGGPGPSCTLAEAVRCVTENVAALMGESKRGVLEPGRRADFVILDNINHMNNTSSSNSYDTGIGTDDDLDGIGRYSDSETQGSGAGAGAGAGGCMVRETWIAGVRVYTRSKAGTKKEEEEIG